eukprot:3851360-Alexandrium_andersonii.AAC.1
MLAATPPLEAVRVLFSDLATSGRARARGRRPGPRQVLLIDVRKAHLRASVHEDAYVAPPRRWPSLGRALSLYGVCTVRGPRRPVGGPFTPRPWRASAPSG